MGWSDTYTVYLNQEYYRFDVLLYDKNNKTSISILKSRTCAECIPRTVLNLEINHKFFTEEFFSPKRGSFRHQTFI